MLKLRSVEGGCQSSLPEVCAHEDDDDWPAHSEHAVWTMELVEAHLEASSLSAVSHRSVLREDSSPYEGGCPVLARNQVHSHASAMHASVVPQ